MLINMSSDTPQNYQNAMPDENDHSAKQKQNYKKLPGTSANIHSIQYV